MAFKDGFKKTACVYKESGALWNAAKTIGKVALKPAGWAAKGVGKALGLGARGSVAVAKPVAKAAVSGGKWAANKALPTTESKVNAGLNALGLAAATRANIDTMAQASE